MRQSTSSTSLISENNEPKAWHVLVTKGNHTKKVNSQLLLKNIETYLPLTKRVRQWCDRRREVEMPIFGNYIFVNVNLKERLMALQTDGCARYVCFGHGPAIVREEEIANLKNVFDHVQNPEIVHYAKEGDLVEIVRGPLRGVCGLVEKYKGKHRILVSVKTINHSIALDVDPADLKLVT